jgi:lipid A 3-O-deacylase
MRFPSLLNVTLVLGIYFSDLSVNEVLGQKKALTKQVKLQHDNDAFRIEQKTDRYYSFGLLLNYSTAVTENNPLKKTSEKLGFKESEKLIFDNLLYLKGYTPEFQTDPSNVSNRPFAGVLNWEPSVYISNEKRLWRFGIVLGVRGKISGAEWVQDNFHDLIGDKKFEGWRYQLPNKFGN